MSNRERMIATIKHEETDYIPLHLEFNQSYEIHDFAKNWRDQFQRIDDILGLGVDAAMEIWFPNPRTHKDVTVYSWREKIPGEKYTRLCKEYITPAGRLKQVIKETEDLYDYWHINKNTLGLMHSRISGVGMVEDVNPSRSIEFLIKGPEDLEKMRYLFQPISGEELKHWRDGALYTKNEAQKRDVILMARRLWCGSAMVWLTNVLDSIESLILNPEYMKEFFSIIQEWQMKNLEIMLDIGGIDIVTRFGYYDIPDFFGVKQFEKYLAPGLNQEAKMCHESQAFLSQQQSKGLTDLVDVYKRIDVDILRDVDPVQGRENMKLLKKELGDKKTFWGGINLLDLSDQNNKCQKGLDVDAMVKKAFDDLAGGGGFVLYPVTGLYVEVKWEDVLKMIEAWKKYRFEYNH